MTQAITVRQEDRPLLDRWAASDAHGGALHRRARIVLLAGAGLDVSETARTLGVTRTTAATWRARYARDGLAGLCDLARPGRGRTVSDLAVVRATAGRAPDGEPWTSRTLAERLGISNGSVARVWRRWGIDATRPTRLRPATAPALPGVVHEVAGVYADPWTRLLAVRVSSANVVFTARRPGGAVPAEAGDRHAAGDRVVDVVAGDPVAGLAELGRGPAVPAAGPAGPAAGPAGPAPGPVVAVEPRRGPTHDGDRLGAFCRRLGGTARVAAPVHVIRFDGPRARRRDDLREHLAAHPALCLHTPVPGLVWVEAVATTLTVLAEARHHSHLR